MKDHKILIGIITVLAIASLGLSWALLSIDPPVEVDEAKTMELTEESDSDDEAEEVTAQADANGLEPGYLISVHIEPTTNPKQQMEHWLTLVELVNLSDEYDMKLSLHFSASMASLVLDNMEFVDTVRGWERDGHEIGVHHHDPSHHSWDGYTDDKSLMRHKDYVGTIDDMMELVSALSVDGEIVTGSGTSDPDEWPEGVIYASRGGSPPTYLEMIDESYLETMGTTIATFLPKAPFGVDMISQANNATYERIETALNEIQPDQYLGLAVTDQTLDDESFAELERVYQLYVENDIQTQTIEVLLNR
jgi:hypothetical protein